MLYLKVCVLYLTQNKYSKVEISPYEENSGCPPKSNKIKVVISKKQLTTFNNNDCQMVFFSYSFYIFSCGLFSVVVVAAAVAMFA